MLQITAGPPYAVGTPKNLGSPGPELTVVDGIYIIPEALSNSVLLLAHVGHPGLDAFLDTLRKRACWLGVTTDVTNFMERCVVCWQRRTNHATDVQPSEIEGVWRRSAFDLVSIEGHTCLSSLDYGY